MGAIFGLAGIFAAACLYLFYALIKLVFLLAAFSGFQRHLYSVTHAA